MNGWLPHFKARRAFMQDLATSLSKGKAPIAVMTPKQYRGKPRLTIPLGFWTFTPPTPRAMTLHEIRASISSNPWDRIPLALKTNLEAGFPFTDIHTHVFTIDDVPEKFLGIRIPYSTKLLEFAENLLRKIGIGNKSKLDRLANFLDIINKKKSEDIFKLLDSIYHQTGAPNALYGVLMMDMAIGIEGPPERCLRDQMDVIRDLRNLYPTRMLPFMAIDPRRQNAMELFYEAFSNDRPYKFFGLKVYPCLGYLPSHPTLMLMLEICEEKQIPVLSHCSGASVHSSYKKIEVEGLRLNGAGQAIPFKETVKFKRRNDYATYFNDAAFWEPVLKRFPKLKLNLAHFGGGDQWEDYVKGKPSWVQTIIQYFGEYENVYADFSYTFHERNFSIKLKALLDSSPQVASRTLFGSDFYMMVREGHYNDLFKNFRTDITTAHLQQIATTNMKAYLFGKEAANPVVV